MSVGVSIYLCPLCANLASLVNGHASLSPDPTSASSNSSAASLQLLPTPSPPRNLHPSLSPASPSLVARAPYPYWPSDAGDNWSTAAPAAGNKRRYEDDHGYDALPVDDFVNDMKKRRLEPSYDPRNYPLDFPESRTNLYF